MSCAAAGTTSDTENSKDMKHSLAASPCRHWYLNLGAQSAAPSGSRSRKCQIEQKASPGPKLVSDTRTILSPRFLNTDTPGSQPPSRWYPMSAAKVVSRCDTM